MLGLYRDYVGILVWVYGICLKDGIFLVREREGR